MSKSTPLSQIPLQLPANVSKDETIEDDATIQEVLSQFTNTSNQQEDMLQQQQQMQHEMLQQQQMQQQYQQQMMEMADAKAIVNEDTRAKIMDEMFAWNDDLKMTIAVIIIYIIVTIIPVEKFVYKYIASLDKIPYSSLVVKAFLAGSVYFVIRKLYH
jgi:small-conductance mechanosensitive channel